MHKIGVVFQRPVFFDWLDIASNVSLPARIAGIAAHLNTALNLLSRFGIGDAAKAFPHELSGGMLARAALARALVHNPEFLFFDEAFDHLDEHLRVGISMDIQEHWMESRPTIVAITHNLLEAVWMADAVVILSRRPAQVLEVVPVNLPRPRGISIMSDKTFLSIVRRVRKRLDEAYSL